MMKQRKRHFLSLGIIGFAALSFVASATQKQAAFISPTFSWSPKTTVTDSKRDFTFALVKPSYTDKSMARYEPFRSFSDNLAEDFQELLTARGYTIRGPFTSRDELLYSDKVESDLILLINVEPRLEGGSFVTSGRCENGVPGYKLTGNFTLYGRITIKAIEPMSGENIWTKNVDIPERVSTPLSSLGGYCTQNPYLFLERESGIRNPVTELMQQGYTDILDKIWNHFDPAEFDRLRSQIQELKNK